MSEPSGETDSLRVVIAHFSSTKDNRPVVEETTWGELRARLTRFGIRVSKEGPLWSPVSYKPGTTRGNANIEAVYLAVMDVDDGTDPAYIVSKLTGTYEFIIYSTFSSTSENPRYRVVVPLGKPCPAKKWPAIWGRLCDLLTGGHTDRSTKDAARIFFWPTARPDGKTFTYSGHGRALAPADLPPVAEAPTAASAGVPLDSTGRLPHGRHYEWLRSFTATFTARTPGATEAQVVEAARAGFGAIADDLPSHEAEIRGLARSAVGKFGRPAPSGASGRTVRDVLGDGL